MIHQLTGFGPEVLAFAGSGRITARDYREVVVPAVEEALKRPGKLRLFYRLEADFAGFDAGAMWEDAKVGLEHLTRWDRVAVVSDVDWLVQAVRGFGFLMPARVRTFSLAEAAAAKAWIVGDTAA